MYLLCLRCAECLAEIGQAPSEDAAENNSSSSNNIYAQVFKLKSVHLLAVFILVYIGVEVTIGGERFPAFRLPSLMTPCRLDCDFPGL